MKIDILLEIIIKQQVEIIDYQKRQLDFLRFLPIISKNTDLKDICYTMQKETYELAEEGKKIKKIKEILI